MALNFRREVVFSTNLSSTFSAFNNCKLKATFINPLPSVQYKNQQKSYNFTFNYLRKESFGTLSVVMYFKKNFFLAKAINNIIHKLQSGGIIEYWHDENLHKEKLKVEQKSEKQLSFSHLAGVCKIWLIGNCVAVATFLLECCFKRLKSKTVDIETCKKYEISLSQA
jgi:hypothetical protein